MMHPLAAGYSSSLQIVRVLTEKWLNDQGYCPSCSNRLVRQSNNSPASDFRCLECDLDFELKSKHGPFGNKVVDGAYSTMMRRVQSDSAPNLFLLSYSKPEYRVEALQIIPSYFLHSGVIEAKRPLSEHAVRAGWQGCNIIVGKLPRLARIDIVTNGQVVSKATVRNQWTDSTLLRRIAVQNRGWLSDTMRCIDDLGTITFSLEDIYKFEPELQQNYPNNHNIRPKLRQQLQKLRDLGYVRFIGRGKYIRTPNL